MFVTVAGAAPGWTSATAGRVRRSLARRELPAGVTARLDAPAPGPRTAAPRRLDAVAALTALPSTATLAARVRRVGTDVLIAGAASRLPGDLRRPGLSLASVGARRERPPAAVVLTGTAGSIARRPARAEHRPPALAFEVARRDPATGAPAAGPAAAPPRGPHWSSPARPPAAASLAEVEEAVTARLERRLDQKISATIRATLGTDGEVSRAMTDRVYGALYDRLVLERERLG